MSDNKGAAAAKKEMTKKEKKHLKKVNLLKVGEKLRKKTIPLMEKLLQSLKLIYT